MNHLQQGLQSKRKWTLVSAPPGYGKSTLISEWLQPGDRADVKIPFAWLSLDKKDNDPVRFLTYYIAALKKVHPEIGQSALNLLNSLRKPDPETLLTVLINDIADVPTHFIFVLDDYHQIEEQKVHELLTFFLDHLPENLHLVLITRRDPALPISRFRVHSQVTEVRTNHLRFTREETHQFFRSRRIELTPEWVHTLADRTEGWIAGLSLAALSMQEHENLESFLQSFSGTHRYILDYLIDEVMQQQPAALQSFLTQTAILDRFCAPLCDALLNRTDSQELLAQVERANLFLIPLDDQRIWYRYHQLFTDSLRVSLEQFQPHQVEELHLRAATWFEKNNLVDEAIQHALVARDWDHAAQLMEAYAHRVIFEHNDPSSFNAWFDILPRETLDQHTALLTKKAWSELMLSSLNAGEYWLNQAIASCKAVDPLDQRTRAILGEAYTAGAIVGVLAGDGEKVARFARPALEMLPPEAVYMRCIAQWCVAQDYRYHWELTKSEQAFAEAARMSKAAGLKFFHLLSFNSQGVRLVEMGRLQEAARVFQEINQITSQGSRPPPIASEVLLQYGCVLLEWNRLEEASNLIEQGAQLARQTGLQEVTINACEFLAHLQMARQDVTGALATIEEGIQAAQSYQVPFRLVLLRARQAYLWLLAALLDNTPTYRALISAWARETRAILNRPFDPLQFNTYLTLARADILEGQWAECAGILDRLQQFSIRAGHENGRIKAQVLKAWLLESQGKREEALEALHGALEKAMPEGYVRVFLEIGPPMETLLGAFSKVPFSTPFSGYLQMLLSAFAQARNAAARTVEERKESFRSPADPQLIEPLNERELEILRLMAQGLSNSEIAQHLSLSTRTIKWYAYNLYNKLGVNSRTQAIAAARQHSILQ